MKNSQKGFVVPLLIAIIAVLVIGGGVYVYEKNKKTETPVVDTGTQQINTVKADVTYSISGNNISVVSNGKVTQTLALGQDGIDALNFIIKRSTGGINIPLAFITDKDVNFELNLKTIVGLFIFRITEKFLH